MKIFTNIGTTVTYTGYSITDEAIPDIPIYSLQDLLKCGSYSSIRATSYLHEDDEGHHMAKTDK